MPLRPANLRQEIEALGVDALIVPNDLDDATLSGVIHEALELNCRVVYPARATPALGVRPRLLWHDGAPFFEVGTPVLRGTAVMIKRVSDVVGAVVALIVVAPVMALIAIAIRLDSRGPIFYAQERAGLGGRIFRMLKFRSMTEDADGRKQELAHLNRSGDARLFKIESDPRVTRVGKFLRRWSLDELPQLINVLKGDMSLVGPRPFFESDFAQYENHHFRRLDTKPGITGLWQVSGRSDVVNFEDVIFLDRQYIEQWSVWLDLSILARTIPAVFRRKGAY
jgi:exopolysaccharide biosynthesis polyprenyl glycosylphosphotransferase